MSSKNSVREAIVTLHRAGHTNSNIVDLLKKSKVTYKVVYNAVKRYKETGSTSDRPRSGRPRTACTSDRIKRVREKIRRNPARSIRKLAREENVGYASMWGIVRDHLEMTPYKKIRLHLLSAMTKAKRMERGRILLNRFKSGTQGPVLFTDEKLFTVQAIHNAQNDRILAKNSKDIPVEVRATFRRQKPASVMVWAGVMTDGKKTPLIFVPEGVKVNQVTYLEMLDKQVLPWLKNEYGDEVFTFMQDGAPAHTAKKVQDWCRKNFPDFWDKLMWPPSSPDLNVMDFAM